MLDVLHGDAALDYQEALRVLGHNAQLRRRRAEFVAREDGHVLLLRLVDGDGSERLVTLLQLVLLLRAKRHGGRNHERGCGERQMMANRTLPSTLSG